MVETTLIDPRTRESFSSLDDHQKSDSSRELELIDSMRGMLNMPKYQKEHLYKKR